MDREWKQFPYRNVHFDSNSMVAPSFKTKKNTRMHTNDFYEENSIKDNK